MKKIKINDILKLLALIFTCQFIGFVGSLFTRISVSTWYVTLIKPSFTPPNWVFAPIWFFLYTLMAVSAFLIVQKGLENPRVNMGLNIFTLQLMLNLLWSATFFGLKSIIGGLVVIVMLWLGIIWTIIAFFKVSRLAGILLIPYIIWVSFAAILNIAILILNH